MSDKPAAPSLQLPPEGAGIAWTRLAYNGKGPYTIYNMDAAYVAGWLARAALRGTTPTPAAAALELLERAYEVVHHDSECPAIGGNGDPDCRCDAVPFLRDLKAALAAQPAPTVEYDRKLIARILDDYEDVCSGLADAKTKSRYSHQAVADQIALLLAADNRDAEGVRTVCLPAPTAEGGELPRFLIRMLLEHMIIDDDGNDCFADWKGERVSVKRLAGEYLEATK